MFAQINHMAIISSNYALLEKFYRSMFNFDTSGRNDAESASVVSDGYLGMNIIPHRDGYVGGLDHFGMIVDSIDEVQERMKSANPKANLVKRPSARPFAAYSGHDPDGNVFDLSERNGANLKDVYAEHEGEGDSEACYFNRFALRTPNAEQCAEFYAEVFELTPTNRKPDDPNFHLTDGRMTLTVMPWSIETFHGMSIKRPGPDHLGIHVADLGEFEKERKRIGEKNTYLATRTMGGSQESEIRRKLFGSNALGKIQIADPDGTWIDITDE
jgi:catechol 2,3-dioxygenase-like lactoylglutathione lyase family enzyme